MESSFSTLMPSFLETSSKIQSADQSEITKSLTKRLMLQSILQLISKNLKPELQKGLIKSYNSTEVWTPQIHVFDWLICCCEISYFIKKRNENDKNTNFMMKNSKKLSKKYKKALSN